MEKKTVLLVEDDVLIAMGGQITLEKAGYQVILAGSGEDAVKVVETTPGIDLILMDIDLGQGIDGTEAAAIILRDRDLPVVFLSSHAEPEIVEKTEKIISYGYVVKGSNDTVLLASIKIAQKLFAEKMERKRAEDGSQRTFPAKKSLVYNRKTETVLGVATLTTEITERKRKATLTIQDDGVGLPDELDIESSKQFGLMLVRMLAQQLEGTFSIESHLGTRSVLAFGI
jgi:CheY-like chemotaxis protein